MKISTKGRYALRFAIDVAQHESEGPVALREVAQRQNISTKYLEQLVGQLAHGGLITSHRGAHGGYTLAKPASELSAGEILRICEGGTAPVACLEDDYGICPRRGECEAISFWEGLEKVIENYVDSVSLADLVPKHASTQKEA